MAELYQQRQLDLLMMILSGAKASMEKGRRNLLGMVDERLKIVEMHYSKWT
jgi:hypothetical protein